MIVEVNNELKEMLIKHLKEEGRREGIHITDLNRCPRRVVLEILGVKGVEDEYSVLSRARGRGIHTELQGAFLFKEVPLEKDGVRGTVDALGERIVEIFTTSSSSRGTLEGLIERNVFMRIKIKQIKAYCYMKGTDRADLVIFFTSGDYVDMKPELKCYTLVFTKNELEENWKEMMRRKKIIEEWVEKVKSGAPISEIPAEPEARECDYCAYRNICFGGEVDAELK